jgi:hypothetical protein
MAAAASALAIVVAGMAVLALGRLSPDGAGMVAVVLPPWQPDALTRVTALDLPLVDLRAGGLLAVVAADAPAQDRLRAAGLQLLAARAAGLCAPAAAGDGTADVQRGGSR